MLGYKVLTHDFRVPYYDTYPLFNDAQEFPFTLPAHIQWKEQVQHKKGCMFYCKPYSPLEVAWSIYDTPENALRAAGMWPDGYPSRLFQINSTYESCKIESGCLGNYVDKRFSVLKELDVNSVIEKVSSSIFSFDVERLTKEQILWRDALSRPYGDPKRVKEELEKAVKYRNLDFQTMQFSNSRLLWDAYLARGDLWSKGEKWDTPVRRLIYKACPMEFSEWEAYYARTTNDQLAGRSAERSLRCCHTSGLKLIDYPCDFLTVGIRDAYKYGLGVVIPIDEKFLGWTMF